MLKDIERIFRESATSRRLMDEFHAKIVILFGSMVSGGKKRDRDVDLAVLFSRPLSEEEQAKLVSFLKDLLVVDRLDVVCLNTVSPALRYEVAQDGMVLLEREEGAFISFCIRSFKEYEEMNFLSRHYYEDKITELKGFARAQSRLSSE